MKLAFPIAVPLQTALLACLLALLLGGVLGYKFGGDAVQADQSGELKQAAKVADRRDQAASEVTTATRADANASQAEIQGETHATQERIHTVYRDHFVAADCRQPDGVSVVMDQAIESANHRVRAAAGAAGAKPPQRQSDLPRHR